MVLPTLPLRLVDSGAVRPISSRELNDDEFFERFSPYVARIGMRLLGRSSDVDDLVQEVFIAAYKKRDQLPDEGATRGWLAVDQHERHR